MSEENQNQPILPPPGTYMARRSGPVTARETDKGALCIYIPYMLLGSPVAFCGEHVLTLNQQDGTLSTVAWDNTYGVFAPLGWVPNAIDKMDPYELENLPLTPDGTAEFIAKDCFHDEYPKGSGKIKFKIQWFNAIGVRQLSVEEKSAQQSKWEVKFPSASSFAKKFVAKTEPASEKPAVVETPVTEPVKKAPGRKSAARPAAKVWTSAEELYNAFLKKHGADTDTKLYKDTDGKMETKETIVANSHWYPACDEVCGKNNPPENSEQFTAIAEKLGL